MPPHVQVAQHPGGSRVEAKSRERLARARTENMRVSAVAGTPSVLRVAHPGPGGRRHVSHVLVGLHRGVTFFDDDGERTPVYTPPGTRLRFRLARGAALFEGLPGLIPIACTCPDFVVRGTTSTTATGGVRSVNRSPNTRGDAAVMGAVLGCKHMLAAEDHLMRGVAASEYFSVPLEGTTTDDPQQ